MSTISRTSPVVDTWLSTKYINFHAKLKMFTKGLNFDSLILKKWLVEGICTYSWSADIFFFCKKLNRFRVPHFHEFATDSRIARKGWIFVCCFSSWMKNQMIVTLSDEVNRANEAKWKRKGHQEDFHRSVSKQKIRLVTRNLALR